MRRLSVLFSLMAALVVTGCSSQSEEVNVYSARKEALIKPLLDRFTSETGITVNVVAVGTGQAIRLAKSGDADILFVHHKPSEEKFVAEGFGVERYDVMYNEFVLVGPAADPAGIAGMEGAAAALAKIAEYQAIFDTH